MDAQHCDWSAGSGWLPHRRGPARLAARSRLRIEAAGKYLGDILKAGAGFDQAAQGTELFSPASVIVGEVAKHVYMDIQGCSARLERSAFQLTGENLAWTARQVLCPDRP